MEQLVELDAVEILVIIDNELDPISPCSNPRVEQSGGIKDISKRAQRTPSKGGETVHELRMSNICCSAHGLSLMITGVKDGQRRTILFDTGPEGEAWERNATRLGVDAGRIEAITLSHWHRDHSGGMLKALKTIADSRAEKGSKLPPVSVDLHPDRPDYRGSLVPGMPIISLEADPSFEEIENSNGVVAKNDQLHTVLNDTFLISGEIPRVTDYEKGFPFGVRYVSKTGNWQKDTDMKDERVLVCRLKDKGLVMFTGCGHAGVVNSAKHVVSLGKGVPLYAVIGGFHLADAQPDVIERAVSDLKETGVQIVLAGHCTGWRAKAEFHRQMPGLFAPSFVHNASTATGIHSANWSGLELPDKTLGRERHVFEAEEQVEVIFLNYMDLTVPKSKREIHWQSAEGHVDRKPATVITSATKRKPGFAERSPKVDERWPRSSKRRPKVDEWASAIISAPRPRPTAVGSSVNVDVHSPIVSIAALLVLATLLLPSVSSLPTTMAFAPSILSWRVLSLVLVRTRIRTRPTVTRSLRLGSRTAGHLLVD
ncbi:7,8-dihydropterin-6-methyl-4-(beta-D-ribofuranosyl)-aminobenzene-5'-phosphate synthase [Colletotrichum orbiculare MAFF 240422]|uniref:7, 8-dihydropterin-6-methyl-4-(Beta-D-ribofuranosyl)-aminobenzene-5'-phosphate synthase n=1 Tax=Colletotrichum orbiculare (strain 104-T / ATCC 96160 / CBS 514.97 / LARS 414 / MAFF 240422) TaxID=1213857 RepID=A0A484FFZ7_COLOR|nr:7,8-dihydropterin-6-methyl-4-(beta-D-ribofuranosyl)-aminobenzene-5'-phosphate synthase [Colletotrichum orbiculare MAFF 240422]